jgi:hypothetical protein
MSRIASVSSAPQATSAMGRPASPATAAMASPHAISPRAEAWASNEWTVARTWLPVCR